MLKMFVLMQSWPSPPKTTSLYTRRIT